MIGRVQGVLLEVDPPHVLVDVQGVGYEIEVPTSALYNLPPQGNKVVLHTHYVVREDAHLLYGFPTKRERELFRLLIKVNGVGPKLALAILSGFEPTTFVRCVEENNVTALTKLPGVGRKTAERLLVEMRDRLKDWYVEAGASFALARREGTAVTGNLDLDEAQAALIALGYKPPEAVRAVQAVAKEGMRAEDIIREALKGMAKV